MAMFFLLINIIVFLMIYNLFLHESIDILSLIIFICIFRLLNSIV